MVLFTIAFKLFRKISNISVEFCMALINVCNFQITPASGVKPPEQNVSRKVARMCTFLVSTLIVLWTPFQIDMLFIAYGSNKLIARSLSSPLFILANANSCINPVVYGFMWKPMREALLHVCTATKQLIYRYIS